MRPEIDLNELARRESEQVEWKENVADIDDVVATLSAFANDLMNLGGGYVVCGAREDTDEHGFQRLVRTGLSASRLKEIEGKILDRCRERVSPPITPLVDELPSDTPGRRTLVFTVPATPHAHTLRRDREGTCHYVRLGRSTRQARNGLLLQLLVRKGDMAAWDHRPAAGATVEDLDLLAIRDTLARMGLGDAASNVESFLSDTEALSPFLPPLCVREPLTGVLRPRNFAILLFGRNVQRFIGGAVCHFSIYPGTDRAVPLGKRHDFAGTVLQQAQALGALLNEQVVTLFDKTDMKHPNVFTYPDRALQEAMINALVHRDYMLNDPTRITVFSDRIEIVSPGALPIGISLDALRRGKVSAKWRNQGLAWFFRRLELAQAEGQGIRTIRESMRVVGCPPPTFQANEAHVICTLRANPRTVGLQRALDEAIAKQKPPRLPRRPKGRRG